MATTSLALPRLCRAAHSRGNLRANGGPQAAWNAVIGQHQRIFGAEDIDTLVGLIRDLAEHRTSRTPGAVLQHGQAEHALEAHPLSDRLRLQTASDPLRTAVPFRGGMLGAAQFPTLWGSVTAPRRYLDALLADSQDRPWAVELKDQRAGGGHGAYLRKGITQAVLYRHYIRSTSALDAWFDNHGLDRQDCQAALAFPIATPNAAAQVSGHREIAHSFDVEIIEFTRPGD